MKYFELIEPAVEDFDALGREIEGDDARWEEQKGRQETARAQRESTSVPLRGIRRSKIQGRRRRDVHETRYTRSARSYPVIVRFIERFAALRGGTLGRAKLARLAPGAHIYAHMDRGEYYRIRDRYHLVLRSPSGSPLGAGDEDVRMHEGELWWFDNKQWHRAHNDSDAYRVHLIFDVEPASPNLQRSQHNAGARFEQLDLVVAWSEAERRARKLCRDGTDSAPDARRAHAEFIAAGVHLYAVGRQDPASWIGCLQERGVESIADSHPLLAVARALLPEAATPLEVHSARAMGWALARVETGALEPTAIADAIEELGGVEAVAEQWGAVLRGPK